MNLFKMLFGVKEEKVMLDTPSIMAELPRIKPLRVKGIYPFYGEVEEPTKRDMCTSLHQLINFLKTYLPEMIQDGHYIHYNNFYIELYTPYNNLLNDDYKPTFIFNIYDYKIEYKGKLVLSENSFYGAGEFNAINCDHNLSNLKFLLNSISKGFVTDIVESRKFTLLNNKIEDFYSNPEKTFYKSLDGKTHFYIIGNKYFDSIEIVFNNFDDWSLIEDENKIYELVYKNDFVKCNDPKIDYWEHFVNIEIESKKKHMTDLYNEVSSNMIKCEKYIKKFRDNNLYTHVKKIKTYSDYNDFLCRIETPNIYKDECVLVENAIELYYKKATNITEIIIDSTRKEEIEEFEALMELLSN